MIIGIPKITIPVKRNELSITVIENYLNDILSFYREIQHKIRHNYSVYLGQHKIFDKKRPYESDSAINNIVSEPHLTACVDFKTSYALGNPKEYTETNGTHDEQMIYLKKYLRDVHIDKIDIDVAKYAYATGVGYYFILPKQVDKKGERANFMLDCISSDSCFKVYSAYIDQDELFDVIINDIHKIEDNGVRRNYTIMSIYTRDMYYEYECDSDDASGINTLLKEEKRGTFGYLPLVELRANDDGVSIVERGLPLQDAIDNIVSTQLDYLEETANPLYVFVDVNLGETSEKMQENFLSMKKNGLVVLTSAGEKTGNLQLLNQMNKQDDFETMYAQRVQTLYDTLAVPLASSSVTSGGDTGVARSLGNGWDNAYTAILSDTNNFRKSYMQLLERILAISNAWGKTVGLDHTNIEIKFNINRSDNMLVKSQSYSNYTQQGVPPALALKLTGASHDVEADGRLIEENIAKNKEQNISPLNTAKTENDNDGK